MVDYGLLGAIGSGLQQGLNSYQSAKEYNDKLKLQTEDKQMKLRNQQMEEKSKGLMHNESPNGTGSYEYTPEKQSEVDLTRQANLSEKQGLIDKRDPTSEASKSAVAAGQAVVSRFPQFRGLIHEGMSEEQVNKILSEGSMGKAITGEYALAKPKEKDPLAQMYMAEKLDKIREEKETLKGPQAAAAGYAARAKNSEDVFNRLKEQGYEPQGLMAAVQRNGLFPDALRSSAAQEQEQAERSLVNAILRKESGAAISKSEFDSAEKQYFPRQGDSPGTLAQKAQNRAVARAALEAEAGPKAINKVAALTGESIQPQPGVQAGSVPSANAYSPSHPKKGQVMSGYIFKGGDPADKNNWKKK